MTWGVRNISGFVRYVILINDQFPGPLIEATEGDTIVVTVHNQMDKSLMSIHWHGMLQRNNNIMDGVNGVTQKPLGPGQSQVYTFVADLQGTFWYHSHFKKQYMDGLRGPIRIHPFESLASLNAAANNFSLTIAEQYALVTPVNMPLQLSELYSNRTETNNGNTPQTSIIGAYGQGNCTGLRCDYYVVQAQPGNDCSKVTNQTLSLIFVNTGGFAFFDVSVDEHYLIVVSLDSVGVIPSNSSTFISLAPGQRVGVVVCPASPEATAKAQKGGLFWINATQNFFQVFTDTGSLPVFPTALGILSYDPYLTGPKVKALPTSNPWPIDDNAVLKLTLGVSQEVFGLQPISMTSILNGSGVPPEPTAQKVFGLWGFPDSVFPKLFFHVNSSFTFDPNRSNYDTTNGWIAMQLPKPSEESWLYDARNSTLPQNSNGGPNVLHFDKGDVVQFVFNNLDNFPHPFHIHGHWAWVMYQGPINDGPYVGQELISTPVLRDTIVVAEYSSLILRWVADNPGMWIMHCHIDGHLEAGLAFVLSYGEV